MGSFVSGTKKYVDTGLEQADYKLPGWCHIYNRNFELLSDTLLKIQGLVDVDSSYMPDGGVLLWRAASSRWVVRRFS